MESALDEIVQEFLVESYDSLDKLERDLVSLERSPDDTALIAGIFRNLHTLKGCCGYLGFEKLERVSHAGENLLGRLREGSLSVNAEVTDTLLNVNDAVRLLLTQIEQDGKEGDFDTQALSARVRILISGECAPAAAPAPAEADREEPLAPGLQSEAPAGSLSQSTIRVDVGLLDELMNLVGELVLARNQLLQHTSRFEDGSLQSTGQRLNHITTELQARIMKTRMQPIGNVWHKLPRLVRDTAATCGKQVTMSMEGQDTELDRTILEAIKDPLTHIVRNAIDHGIEAPHRRTLSSKPAEGRLVLRAFHEGGQVNIEIVDDGGGVDVDRVRQRARGCGIAAPDTLARMSDREITQLIFHPGFSTADEVTNVSGRGVGMDVVKTNIEEIGGQVEIESVLGQGATVKIRIPLTLAIIPALIVICGGQRFALPQVSLHELVRLEGAAARSGIERVHGVPVYRLRGKLLPIVYLSRALGMPDPAPVPEEDLELNIVVLQGGDQRFGLVVDAILDTEEIVVKPLSGRLKGLAVYAGSTIMGDGLIALILDAQGLAQRAGLNAGATARALSRLSEAQEQASGADKQVLLLVQVGERRVAMPLSAVSRLEEFPADAIERVGQDLVVQYRGGILPLLPLKSLLGGSGSIGDGDGLLRVVVRAVKDGVVGLVVDQILDIVAESFETHPVQSDPLVEGYAVILSRVTELLDIEAVLRSADIGFIGTAA